MAFGFGFALTAIAKAVGFSPSSLFASGAQGVWYDPSDLTTLFEDSAGTIPITSPLEKPVGLMLDKSRGLVLGPELVTNGDFSNGTTGWAVGGNGSVSVVDGYLRVVAGDVFGAYQTVTTTAGKWYEVRGQIAMISGGTNVRIRAESGTIPGSTPIASSSSVTGTTPTDVVFIFLAAASSHAIYLRVETTGSVGRFDNISVRELPGNHATQSTTTSRPTLSARYNLLTKTEQFNDVYWDYNGVSILANQTVSPNNTNTADLITLLATNSIHRVYNNTSTTFFSGTSFVYSLYVKANGYTQVALRESKTTGAGAVFNLSNATVTGVYNAGGVTVSSASITNFGNNWYKISATLSSSTSINYNFGFYVLDGNWTAGTIEYDWTPNGTSGVYIWGADLRVANDGIGLPAYQRVNTATDYDYAGFPPYLKFDGTDDSMVTGSIDFTGTDKMSVFAGVRKLSDAAQAVVAELSVNRFTNVGAFTLTAPNAPGDNFSWQARGSIDSAALAATPYPAPVTAVVSATSDISTDSRVLRVNNAEFTVTADQGAGNYGNYPLYIGRRGGTTLPFNGRLYSLVVCGKLASAAEIASTEAYINQKTRAY